VVWVDGSPAALVTALGVRFGVPVGKPDGWDPVLVEPWIPVVLDLPPDDSPTLLEAAIG
jgi:hypothetical protein